MKNRQFDGKRATKCTSTGPGSSEATTFFSDWLRRGTEPQQSLCEPLIVYTRDSIQLVKDKDFRTKWPLRYISSSHTHVRERRYSKVSQMYIHSQKKSSEGFLALFDSSKGE